MEENFNFLNVMQEHLEKIGKLNPPTQAQLDRKEGITLDFSTHVKYMIYALLSNQERWIHVENNLSEIDKVFFNYNIEKIKEKSGNYFFEKIKSYLTRGLSFEKQMKSLHKNIEILELINNENNGDIDSYIVSKQPKEIIIDFNTKYKLPNMGVSLICEYLKNVGVECAKPDTHIMRFLSKTRRGFLLKDEAHIVKKGKKIETIWTDNDKIKALKIIENMGEKSGKTSSEIDRIIWSYCADGKGEICTKSPKCNICVIKDRCNRDKPGVKF